VAAAPPGDVIATAGTDVFQLNGSAWSPIVPAPPQVKFAAYAVTIPAPNDAWILGGNATRAENEAAHWNGQRWRYLKLPGEDGIFVAAAQGANNIWATDYATLLHFTC
jgi:hypothetical protein